MKQHKCNKTVVTLLASAFLFALSGLPSPIAFANGGVSDGGGGTTHPETSNPEWIVQSPHQFGGKVILTWLNAKEASFNLMSEKEKATSPLRKLFGPGKKIFDVVRETGIEFRMTRPCFDNKGAPWDGSIYADAVKSICISPMKMAPKLNEENYEAETLALIIHEMSHLLGTTEDEAVEIQKSAIYDLSHVEFLDLSVSLSILLGSSAITFPIFQEFAREVDNLQFPQSYNEMHGILNDLEGLLNAITFNHGRVQALHQSTLDSFQPQYVRIEAMIDGSCSQDSEQSKSLKDYCLSRVNTAFLGNASATAQEIESRFHSSELKVPGGDLVTIRRTDARENFENERTRLQKFLGEVFKELKSVQDFDFRISVERELPKTAPI